MLVVSKDRATMCVGTRNMFEKDRGWCLSWLSSQVRPIQMEFRVWLRREWNSYCQAIAQMVVVFGKSCLSTGFEHSPNGVVKVRSSGFMERAVIG